MAANLRKHYAPTTVQLPLYYVTRAGRITKVSWDQMTTSERESQRQADERAYQVVLFGIYGQEAR